MNKEIRLYVPASAAACIGIVMSVILFCYLRVNETKYIQEQFNFSARKVFTGLKDQLIKEGLTPLRLINSYSSTMRIAGRHKMTERTFRLIARMILSAGSESARERIFWFSGECRAHSSTEAPAESSRSFPLVFSESIPDTDGSEVKQHLSRNAVKEYVETIIDSAHSDDDFKTRIGVVIGQPGRILFFMPVKNIRILAAENSSISQFMNNIYGIAGLDFRFDRFMDNSAEHMGHNYETIEVTISGKNGKKEHLYSVSRVERDDRISTPKGSERTAIIPWEGSVAVGNSLFTFRFFPSGKYVASLRSIEPLLILCMGILFSTITSIYLFILLVQKRKIRDIAIRDSLTGVFNRGHFIRCLKEETGRCQQNGDTLSIIMMDIDYFKHINDQYGHTVGDTVLLTFARIIQNYVRKHDIPGRVGGEEFAVAFPCTDTDDATTIADRIRARLAGESFTGPSGKHFSVTVSIGIALFAPDDSVTDFLHRADQALYQAKEQGRNKIIAD